MAEPEGNGTRLRFAGWTTAAWVLLTIPRLLTHELWRDEAWQWLVVLESHSLGELFDGVSRGGGSGYLYPLLCYLARQVSTAPLAMQIVQLAVAAAAVFVFARWAPFGRIETALFVFGYFPFFEYAVISRPYSLGVLFVWLACAATLSRRPAIALGAALGLLCQTTVYGIILGIAIAGGWLYHRWHSSPGGVKVRRFDGLAGSALAVTGAIAGLMQLDQAPGTRTAAWHTDWQPVIAKAVADLPWRALVPIPNPQLRFWNTNLLDPWPVAQMLAGAAALTLAVALLWRSRVALATFAIGAAGLLAFAYGFLTGSARHQGHLWILLFAALWLGGGTSALGGRSSWRRPTLLALLLVHCAVGLYASAMDVRYPFSNGLAAADLIRRQGLQDMPLLGHREPPAATVALHLGRPLYSPSRRVFTTHPDWGPKQRETSLEQLRCAARDLTRAQGSDIVLVMNHELPAWAEVTPLGSTSGAIAPGEDYTLYRLHLALLAATAATAQCPDEPRSPE